MSESEVIVPKSGPNLADAPEAPPENANVFGYNVASEAKKSFVPESNPNSPLAAGWYDWEGKVS